MSRAWLRRSLLLACLGVVVSLAADVWAGGGGVPIALQAQLTSRVCAFDRNFKARAGTEARVLVVHRGGNAESEATASAFVKVLAELHLAGLPVTIDDVAFSDGPQLASRVKAQKIALVYFAVGLEPEMGRATAALVGADVLTVGASGQFAQNGATVGFDLEEARPKLVLNIRSAKAQNVSFKSELLELARVVE